MVDMKADFTPSGVYELVEKAKELMTVRQVVGESIDRGDITIVPVVAIRGGGGGGGGAGGTELEGNMGTGEGLGFGMTARPVGSYVIHDDKVRWEPAIDVTKIAVASNIVALAAIWAFRRRR